MSDEVRIILIVAANTAMGLAVFTGRSLLPVWMLPVRGKWAMLFFCLLMLVAATAVLVFGGPAGREIR
jgi:hypothetical protein